MKLAEVLNSKYPWSYKEKNKTWANASFKTKNRDLVTVRGVIDGSINILGITFDTNMDQGVTGGGDQFAIFATVIDIIKDMVKLYDPDYIGFSADRSEQSRVALYNKLVSRFKPENFSKLNSIIQVKPTERKSLESHLQDSSDEGYELTVLAKNDLLMY